ncbi:uncharacterized protein TRIVIDRAFT_64123 [Trichoderma virens Gv29-8]|uniref:Uncharacterized protein n=1 Tax=Hypocrea virens (strain Gv29-8 / FGSC 10586) TaxID=413071 RepID=G9MNH6_HYPVG|nr:uncharacterized protein TRIVIDRAFT_64123 [Trichoderma virens Gv29-8]EHK23432.1 hypothetical protein TRIVIDRAFT_64123 [Trichoderma virens Gv29-8]
MGHDSPRADLPRIWAPLGGDQLGKKKKRLITAHSDKRRADQRAKRHSTGCRKGQKKGGRGCSDDAFWFKGVEPTGSPMSRIGATHQSRSGAALFVGLEVMSESVSASSYWHFDCVIFWWAGKNQEKEEKNYNSDVLLFGWDLLGVFLA